MGLQRLPITQEGIAASTSYVDGPPWFEKTAIAASTFHVWVPMQCLPTGLTGAISEERKVNFGLCSLYLPTIAASTPYCGWGNAASAYHLKGRFAL
jgi:hypothetical protein